MVRNVRLGQVSHIKAEEQGWEGCVCSQFSARAKWHKRRGLRSFRRAHIDEYVTSWHACVFECFTMDSQKRYENASASVHVMKAMRFW